MRIVMIGCGALGGLFAHHLVLGGAEVHVVDTDGAHAAAIRAQGLRLQRHDSTETSPLRSAFADVSSLQAALGGAPVDVLVLFTKTWASDAALASARPLVSPRTVLVTLQNGLGNPERLRNAFPGQPVLYGLTTLTSDLLAPGLIEPRSTASGVTDVWALDEADTGAALTAFVALLQRGGIAARVAPDIALSVWKKLVVNCGFNGLCAVADLRCGELMADAAMAPVLDGIADEVAALARAHGVALADAQAREFLQQVGEVSRAHFPSMVYDLRARRATEIETLNGAVQREAARLGLAAPANRLVHGLVKAVEARNAAA